MQDGCWAGLVWSHAAKLRRGLAGLPGCPRQARESSPLEPYWAGLPGCPPGCPPGAVRSAPERRVPKSPCLPRRWQRYMQIDALPHTRGGIGPALVSPECPSLQRDPAHWEGPGAGEGRASAHLQRTCRRDATTERRREGALETSPGSRTSRLAGGPQKQLT